MRDPLYAVAVASIAAFGVFLLALAGLAGAVAIDLIRHGDTAAEGDDIAWDELERELARGRHPSRQAKSE